MKWCVKLEFVLRLYGTCSMRSVFVTLGLVEGVRIAMLSEGAGWLRVFILLLRRAHSPRDASGAEGQAG